MRSSPSCRRIIRSSRVPGRVPRMSSPSERIAASEKRSARSRATKPKEQMSTSSFIAAARRAAQAGCSCVSTNDKDWRETRRLPPRTSPRITSKDQPKDAKSGRRHRRLQHHRENPLAAGWRERGGDRARHLQDGYGSLLEHLDVGPPMPAGEKPAPMQLRPTAGAKMPRLPPSLPRSPR